MNYDVFENFDHEILSSSCEADKQKYMEKLFCELCTPVTNGSYSCINDYLQIEFVSCDYENKCISLRFPVLPWQLNPNYTLHGGMIELFMDVACGILTRFFLKARKAVTVNMTTNFLRSVAPGGSVIVEATIDKLGKRLVFLQSRMIVENNDTLVATATSTFMI